MKALKITMIFILTCFVIFLYRCIPPEIILPGDLAGIVSDAETSEPIKTATVKSNLSGIITDTTITGSDGSYILKNLAPGDYELQALKKDYFTESENVKVHSAKTREMNFALSKIPFPIISPSVLDFSIDKNTLYFTISNTSADKLTYALQPGQNWITVVPTAGEITDETDTITVTINRTGLSTNIIKEKINLKSWISAKEIPDITIHVYLNGLMSRDSSSYYKIVRIGTQIWMAENLNEGDKFVLLDATNIPTNNQRIEKVCYDNDNYNCNNYGGLYHWDEMMDYSPSDDGMIGTTQGICPDGWHIPTKQEWQTLINYLGGTDSAKIKLTEGTTNCLNDNPRKNASGFTAKFGGIYEDDLKFHLNGALDAFWASSEHEVYSTRAYHLVCGCGLNIQGNLRPPQVIIGCRPKNGFYSVRCIKDH